MVARIVRDDEVAGSNPVSPTNIKMQIKNIQKIPIPKAKRLFDIILAVFLLTIFLPLFILILLAIFIDHILRGKIFAPLFYKEIRISQGRPFKFVKFNVFKPNVIAEMKKNQEFIHTKKLEHDHKSLTKIGQVVQKIYLDELPQLFNVIKGNMSMVGPRPVNQENYQKILNQGITTKTIVKAGLTGNYQSHKGEPGMNQEQLDREYINFCLNNPFWKIILMDIKIIFRTLSVIFKAKGI